MLQPDIRWSNYPLPPPPKPPFSLPPPPDLPTHDQICKACQALRVYSGTCRPITTSLQFEPNIYGDKTSTNYKPPASKNYNHSNIECQTAINIAPNHPDCKHSQHDRSAVCCSRDFIKSKGVSADTCESTKTCNPPKCESEDVTQSTKAMRRPFTIPGLPKDYIHADPKDYNVPPPFICSEGSVLNFLRVKSGNDVHAYIHQLCQLSSSKTHCLPSGDNCVSRKNDGQITPVKQICFSRPTVEFIPESKSSRSSQIDLCESLVTPVKLCSPSDIYKHIHNNITPPQEDLQKTKTERKDICKSICRPQYPMEQTNKGEINSKQSLEGFSKESSRSAAGESCKHGPQPRITQYCKPKSQTNLFVANKRSKMKKSQQFVSHTCLKLEHFKPAFVPELPKLQNTYKNCIKNQSLSRPVSKFCSQSPRLGKTKYVCPDSPERCPTINSSNPRYSPLPTYKEDSCQSVSRSQNDLQFQNKESRCEPDMVIDSSRNYKNNSPVKNGVKTNMTPNNPLKYCEGYTRDIWRPPLNLDPRTCLNMKNLIDEAKKCNKRKEERERHPEERHHYQIPYNPCCPVHHKGNSKIFKMIFFCLGLPLIFFQVS